MARSNTLPRQQSPTDAPDAASTIAGPRWRRVARRARRWVRNGLLGLLVLVATATLAGQVQQYRLQRAHPPAGQMIEIGDHSLHVVRAGEGASVVFENGTGGMALDWSLVQPALARQAGTFAYDRAGMGWSEPGPRPRTIDVLVEELREALQASGTPAPYVLVGHSFGGLLVRTYAYTYPEEVVGLVLVDASHEDQFDIYPEEYLADGRRMIATMNRFRPAVRLINASGIPALVGGPAVDGIERLPADAAAARRAVGVMDSSQAVTTIDEMVVLEDDVEIVRSRRRPLGDIPVIVITRGETDGATMGIPAESEDEIHAAWLRMQQDLLTISADSTLVIAEGSGHNVHVERPELVIDAVRQVLSRVENSG